MKKFILSFLVLVTLSLNVAAQTNKKSARSEFPVAIGKINSADSGELLNNPAIKTRLRKLLGKKNYASFLESFETITPIVKTRTVLFSSGCLIHACGHVESAIAVDPVNQTVHASFYRDGEKTRFFNENGRKTPLTIRNWAHRLAANK